MGAILPILKINGNAYAQNVDTTQNVVTLLKPLFTYPTPPEELSELSHRGTWLVTHFWDPMDFKQNAVDRSALDHAFGVYATAMRWADKEATVRSINELLKKLGKNPTLMLQFAIAAERNLYGPDADQWSDELYLPFLEAVAAQKKIPDIRKARYLRQAQLIKNSQPGSVALPFEYKNVEGQNLTFTPDSTWIVIEFGDPSCVDCRMARLRMESNSKLSEAVANGKVKICVMLTDPDQKWREEVANYPADWIVGAAEGVDEIYDIRIQPSFWIIAPDNKIAGKNLTVDQAISKVLYGLTLFDVIKNDNTGQKND